VSCNSKFGAALPTSTDSKRDASKARNADNCSLDGKLMTVDLELVEKGIAVGRQMMEEMLKTATSKGDGNEVPASKTAPGNEGAAGNGGASGKTSEEYLNEVGVMAELSKKRAEQ